jgi:hypothetical protein
MKYRILGITLAGALLAAQSTTASAGTDVYVGLQLGAPVVVERRPVYREYYYEPAPVYYESYSYPRTYVYRERYETRYVEGGRHDHGRHRGHHKHRHYR